MAKFIPITDETKIWGEGDYRPLLSKKLRGLGYSIEMIGAGSVKEQLDTIILPSHDYYNLDTEDQAFPTSVAPCWTDVTDAHDGRHFAPSSWAVPLIVYPFLGEKKEHWLSPQNRGNMIGGGECGRDQLADAFDDLKTWVRFHKEFTKDQKDFFLSKPDARTDALVPNRSSRYVSLGYGSDNKNKEKRMQVLLYTGTAHSYVVEQLRWLHEGNAQPRDPNYPRYLIGDPTNPKKALPFHVSKFKVDAKDNTETNVLCLTESRGYLDDRPKETTITDDVLAKRFPLCDPNNWNFPTYEEQVEYMVNSYAEEVTTEMIREACGHRCEIPERRKRSLISNSPAASKPAASFVDPLSAVTGGASESFVPAQGAPVDKAPASAPVERSPDPGPAKESGEKYWSGVKGEAPKKRTCAELQQVYESGKADNYKVCVDGSTWVGIAVCGLFEIARPTEDAPPPMEDTPPAMEDTPPPMGGSDQESPEDAILKIRRNPFDDDAYAALSEDVKASVDSWARRVYEVTGGDASVQVPQPLLDEVILLLD